uniref:hypothetical protein n=1 Tax=Campylobacter fetus TaxID=196 RepID=UPI0013CFA6F3
NTANSGFDGMKSTGDQSLNLSKAPKVLLTKAPFSLKFKTPFEVDITSLVGEKIVAANSYKIK